MKRVINPMPKSILPLLVKDDLLEKYKARPPYQQNDYLRWISRAKLEATNKKESTRCWTNLGRVTAT